MASRDRNSEVRIIKGGTFFVKLPHMPKNVIQFLEFGNLALKQQHLIFRGDDFDASLLFSTSTCTTMLTLYLLDSTVTSS
jgi:hypothetical protein